MEIDTVEKVHSIGYRLKDTKFTAKQDLKINVAGVKAECTSGEMTNLPTWVGKVLADNNLGSYDSPDMIAELKQALTKESSAGSFSLASLDPHFYIQLKETMKALSKHDFDHVESMMLDLFRMRRGKIIRLADSRKLDSDIYSKLTVEENVFFKTIHETGKEFEKQIKGDLNEQN